MTSAPSRKCNGTFPRRRPDDRAEIAGGGAGRNRADRCRMTADQSAGRARSTGPTSQRAPVWLCRLTGAFSDVIRLAPFPSHQGLRRRHHDDAARATSVQHKRRLQPSNVSVEFHLLARPAGVFLTDPAPLPAPFRWVRVATTGGQSSNAMTRRDEHIQRNKNAGHYYRSSRPTACHTTN